MSAPGSSRTYALTPSQAFLTDQLIAYIGNKRKLLDLIGSAIDRTGVRGGTFFDAFAGSGVVSRMAKVRGFQVVANDWEPYCRFINGAYVSLNHLPDFRNFGGPSRFFNHLNNLPGSCGYIATHYCPADDESPDYDSERMFFTQENGRRLDAMREEIARLRNDGLLDDKEQDAALASLIFATGWCSNTSGVFKGFHRGWGGATRTAWYRIRKPVGVRAPVLWDNGCENLTLQEDAKALAPSVPCSIAYLDPPYNQHQYGANYHLLNTMALWDKPKIAPRFSPGVRGIKAAIRLDWRTARNSAFCRRGQAEEELGALVESLRADWVLLSYSTDGIIPMERLVEILGSAGRLSWVYRPYKRYRVSTQRPSPRGHNLEFVLIVERGAPRDPKSTASILRACDSANQKRLSFV